jgi:hypothetical protein
MQGPQSSDLCLARGAGDRSGLDRRPKHRSVTSDDEVCLASVVGTVWSAELDRLHARIAGRFTRSEPRRRARQYLSGLVAGLDRSNGWTLAVQAGDMSPDGMQRLLRWADWDVDAVRDDVRNYVILRHRRADRELPGRRFPGRPLGQGSRVDRPADVSAAGLDR